jgi:hypothetical protein
MTDELASAELGTDESRAFGSVPLVMFEALVTSVVADATSPLMSPAASWPTVTGAPAPLCLNT